MRVIAGKEFACVKLEGKANLALSLSFHTLVEGLRRKGCRFFVLELSGCALMDSTFLGGLAQFGLSMAEGQAAGSRPAIQLLNPNERVIELLSNLGILEFFRCCQGIVEPPPDAEVTELTPSEASRLDLCRASLEAHRFLVSMNEGNAAKFKDVTRFLEEDLKRLEGEGQEPAAGDKAG